MAGLGALRTQWTASIAGCAAFRSAASRSGPLQISGKGLSGCWSGASPLPLHAFPVWCSEVPNGHSMLQVVLRDGMPIHAEVPDYRELDEVPAKLQNVPVQRQPTSCAQNLYKSQAKKKKQCNGAQCNGTSQSKPADQLRIQVGYLCGQQSLVCLALLQCIYRGQCCSCRPRSNNMSQFPCISSVIPMHEYARLHGIAHNVVVH